MCMCMYFACGSNISFSVCYHPPCSTSSSPKVAHLGLLERENAAILNEALKPLSGLTISAFQDALKSLKLSCPLYLTQNDGTLIR